MKIPYCDCIDENWKALKARIQASLTAVKLNGKTYYQTDGTGICDLGTIEVPSKASEITLDDGRTVEKAIADDETAIAGKVNTVDIAEVTDGINMTVTTDTSTKQSVVFTVDDTLAVTGKTVGISDATDARIVKAQNDADTAQTTAEDAQADADNAMSAATTAQTTAGTALGKAETAITNAATAQATAVTAQATAETALEDAETAQTTADTAVANAKTAQNTADTAVANAATAQTTANNAMTKASNAQTDATTAISNAATAQATANNAQTIATTAKQTADTAIDNAETAQTTADTAVNTANTAKENAESAVSTANSASSTASTAYQTAVTAKTTAETADANADDALEKANSAVSTANSASSTASTAYQTAVTAKTTAETADGKADNAQTTADTAVANAKTAQDTADTAVADAKTAQDTANTANSSAATAMMDAFNASTTASAAQSTANTANTIAKAAIKKLIFSNAGDSLVATMQTYNSSSEATVFSIGDGLTWNGTTLSASVPYNDEEWNSFSNKSMSELFADLDEGLYLISMCANDSGATLTATASPTALSLTSQTYGNSFYITSKSDTAVPLGINAIVKKTAFGTIVMQGSMTPSTVIYNPSVNLTANGTSVGNVYAQTHVSGCGDITATFLTDGSFTYVRGNVGIRIECVYNGMVALDSTSIYDTSNINLDSLTGRLIRII